MSWDGDYLGCVLRSEYGDKPKALTHTESGAMAFFRNYNSKLLFIVEDVYSALRISSSHNSVALLGTHINDERVEELRACNCDSYMLCLDKDAFDKAVGYTMKYRSRIGFYPVRLDHDVKNMSQEEYEDFIHGKDSSN